MLSRDIEHATGERLSETTLQRFWMYKAGYDVASVHTLDILCRYVGLGYWDKFIGECCPVKCVTGFADGTQITIGWRPDKVCTIVSRGDDEYSVVGSNSALLPVGTVFRADGFQLGKSLELGIVCGDGEDVRLVIGARDGLCQVDVIKRA